MRVRGLLNSKLHENVIVSMFIKDLTVYYFESRMSNISLTQGMSILNQRMNFDGRR